MRKINSRKVMFLFYIFLLINASILSICFKYWTILTLVLVTFSLIFIPFLFMDKKKVHILSKVDFLLLILIYIFIFLENTRIFSGTDLVFRIFVNLFVSFSIGLVGFSLIYFLIKEKKFLSNLGAEFLAIFTFCFSLGIGTLFEVFRFSINYIFSINILNFNLSAALGFLSVHTLGSFIVSVFAYLYLIDDDKYKVIYYVRKYLGLRRDTSNDLDSVVKVISKGEGDLVEFKESLRTNVHTGKLDKRMEHSVLKTIVAFLNSKGGTLFVGISDSGEIKGLDIDNFKNQDKCKLQLINMIKHQVGVEVSSFVKVNLIDFEDSYFLKIDVDFSNKAVFLIWEGSEEFYIRAGPSSIRITGSKLVSYIATKFQKR